MVIHAGTESGRLPNVASKRGHSRGRLKADGPKKRPKQVIPPEQLRGGGMATAAVTSVHFAFAPRGEPKAVDGEFGMAPVIWQVRYAHNAAC